MSSFDEIRSGLLKKYNVNATGKTGSTNKQSGSTQGTPPQTDATDFQTIRRNLLDKYSVEKTTERQKTVASWGTRFNSTMERISNLSSGSQRTRKNIDGLDSDINSLIRSYDTISEYADRMGIPNAQRYLKQLQEAQRQIKEFKSQFKSDDEWNWYEKYNSQNSDSLQSVLDTLDDGDEKNWLQGYTNQVYNEELPTVDVEASKKKAASLQQLLDAYRQNSRFGTDAKGEAWLQEIREQYGGEEGLERAISRENRRANLAAQEQDRIRNADRFGEVTRNSDFAQKSTYDPGNTDIGYRYVNGDDWERYLLEKQYGQYVEEFGYHAFDSLTDEEKAVYNYYMNTGDRQSAADYLKHIQDPLNKRKGQQIFADGFKGNAGLEFVYGIDAGLDQFRSGVAGVGKMMRGDNTQSAPSATQYASSLMREDLGTSGKKLPSWLGGGTIGQAVYDSVTTTANMVPSILTSAALGLLNPTLGTVAGGAMMGAGAAGSAYQEMIDSGYTVSQARTYGALVGTAEMVMEKLLGGIGKLGGNSPVTRAIAAWAGNVDNALVNLVGRIGGSAISEGMEEGIQEVFSGWLKSQITKEDFYATPADVMYSSLLGAFTGAIFEAPEAAIKVGTQVKGGHDVLKAKGVDSLIQLGRGSENADIQRLAERAANKPSAYNVGGLKAAVSDEVHSQNARDIADSLTRKGMPQKAAQQYGEMISSMLEAGSDTELQRMVMESDPTVGKTLQEIQMPTSSVYQRMTRMDEATGKAPSIDRVAAAYGSQAEDVKNVYRLGETEPGKNLSVADFSYGFQRVFTLGREGARESALTEEIAPGLTQDQIKYAYKLGAEAAAAEIAADKKRRGDNSSVHILYQDGSVGSEVKITGIASMDGDETVYQLSNGTTVGEDKLSFEGDNPVLDAVRDLGLDLDAANVLIRDRNTLPVKDAVVAQGIDDAFRYGSYGYSLDRLAKDSEAAAALTEEMRKVVYNAGRNNPGKEPKKLPATKATTRGKKPGVYFDGGNGRVEAYDGAELGKDGKRKVGVQTALVLQKLGIGGDFYFFESYVNEDGERVYLDEKGVEQKAPNGWYDPADGSIHIDLNAGNDGQGLTLYTLSHELTHFIEQWSKEKYQVLADFLIRNYEKDRSVDDLVRIKQATLSAQRGEAVSYEEAYSEVIANSMEAMLADGNVMQKLAELKKQDVQLVGKIKNFFDNLVRNITRYYKSLTPESNEGKLVLEMIDQFEQLQRLFAEALVDAGENYRAAVEIGMEIDEDTESVAPAVLHSERTWQASDYVQERDKAAAEIAKAIGVSEKKARDYIDSVNGIAKMIAEDRSRLDYFSSPGRSSFISNVEYGGSFDFSTLCKKRRLLTGTFTAIQKALPNTALTAGEILDIRNRMKDAGLEVSCGLCYVEGSRANMGQFAKEFLRLYKQYYPDAWQPNMADVNTPDGIEWVRINHPECYEQYEYFWNHYGTLKAGDKNLFASQQKPKLYQLHTEYKGEILQKFKGDDNVEEKNLNGGIRLQSFSDFEIVHLIDTMQIIMDMSRVGLAGQAYTKVPDFAWALGDTGLKINLSLIAKGVDENGKLIFDDIEGMPIGEAMRLRDRYSANVGTILVAFNDAQLMAAMADDRVDFIIPFHRSQWKKSQYEAMGLPAKTKDYTFMQNEKFIKPQYHEYRGRMVKDKATNYMPNEYWDFRKTGRENAVAYLEMCARNNKRPKFYKLLQNNGDGSFSLKADGSTDGYWKLLIDFKMYDNDGNGSPQVPVRPEFNMAEATRMLNDYAGGHSNFPVAQGIVDEFVKEYKDSHKGVQYSMRDINIDRVFIDYGDSAAEKDAIDQTVASLVSRGKLIKINTEAVNKHSTNISVDNRHDTRVYLKGILRKFTKDSVYFIHNDQYAEAYLTKDGLNHAAGGVITAERVEIFNQFKELVKNAEYAFSSKNDPHSNANKKIGGRIDWDCFVAVAMVGEKRYPVVFKIRTIDYDVRSQIYEMATKKETDGSHDPGQQNERLHGMSDYGVVPSISDDKLTQPDSEVKKFSDRDTQSLSNRSLLTSVEGSTLKHELEVKRIREYKEQIANIEAQEARLAELRAQIRQMSFAKGPRDMKKLAALKEEATKTTNRIDIYNRKLLDLEATPALQKVLAREKRKATQKADDESRATLERYKQEVQAAWNGQKSDAEIMEREFIRLMKDYHKSVAKAKDQSEQLKTYQKDMDLMEKEFVRLMQSSEKAQKETNAFWESEFKRLMREYDAAGRSIERLEAKIQAQRDSAKQKVDSRRRTELRNKIRKDIRELSKILNNGNKKRNVKQGMQDFVSKAIATGEILFADQATDRELIAAGIQCDMSDQERALLAEAERYLRMVEELDGKDGMSEVRQLREKSLSKILKELRPVLERECSRINSADASVAFNNLVESYKTLKESEHAYIANAFNQDVLEYLEALKSKFIGTLIKDMDQNQLKALHKAYKMVLTTIRNANKAFVDGRSIEAEAQQLAQEFRSRKKPGNVVGVVAKNLANAAGWKYEKLYYALKRINSPTLTKLFGMLAESENVTMRDIQEAKAFQMEQVEKYGYNDWDIDKKIDHTFVDNTGQEFRLTLGEMMALYAYSRREGADKHIEIGGFTFGKTALTDAEPATTYKLTADQCAKITGILTGEQKSFAEAMQKYLSKDMGAKGNEVSMKLYGIEMFGEENYFPLHIAGEYKAVAQESQAKAQAGFQAMTNAGFTKARNINSTAPIVLENFMDVWADHVNEMSRYHGAVPALEDIRRVMNYSVYSEAMESSVSVKAAMTNAYGKQAVNYFDDLYREANSGAITDKMDDLPRKMLSAFRKNSVAYSASVVIQQPASIYRARALVDRKYFGKHGFFTLTGGVLRILNRKKWDAACAEMMKYAPGVTMAKEIGGFDTSTGGSIRSYLLDTEKSFTQSMKHDTLTGKAGSVLGLVDDNPIANLPNVADKIAWIEMWEAVKRETVDKNRSLSTDTEAFWQKVGERFTEVVRATQVYDSMFSKSPMLKSRNLAAQYLVSFMNEPNTVANMAENAIRDLTRGEYRAAGKAAAALVTSIVTTNLLKSLVYAMRDDDEDETAKEKYISAVASSLISDINPLNYIPYTRDLWSMWEGYDVERPDVSVIADVINAIRNLQKISDEFHEDMTPDQLEAWDTKADEARWRVAETLSPLFGIPLKNVRRDVLSVINTAGIARSAEPNTARGTTYAWEEGVSGVKRTDKQQLYEARIAGDQEHATRVEARYDDEKSANAAVKSAIREAFMERDIDLATANQYLILHAGVSAAEAHWTVDKWEYTKEHGSDDGYGKYNTFFAAVESGENLQGVVKEYGDYGVTKSTLSGQITERFSQQYMEMNQKERQAFRKKLEAAYTACGYDQEKAAQKLDEWDFKAEVGDRDDVTSARVKNYNLYCKTTKLPKDIYLAIMEFSDNTKNDIDEDGNNIKYSAVEKVMAEMQKYGLTREQKEALAQCFNWGSGTIKHITSKGLW